MKIGCSTYSIRDNLKKGTLSLEEWKTFTDMFPEVKGIEVLSDHAEKFLPDIEIEDFKKLKRIINDAGLEWFSYTTGALDMIPNSVPMWKGINAYLGGFKNVDDMRIGIGSDIIETVGEVGVPVMRIDLGKALMNHEIPYSSALDFNVKRFAKVFLEFVNVGKQTSVTIGFENHGGFASDQKVMETMFDSVPDLKLCLDLGNLPSKRRYEIIDKFADKVHFVHAKTYVFDDKGDEKNIDFQHCIAILKDHSFDGWISIEFEGPGSEEDGIRNTINLLNRYL